MYSGENVVILGIIHHMITGNELARAIVLTSCEETVKYPQ
jgi:hypothetical protein